jgi:hypothetical protein
LSWAPAPKTTERGCQAPSAPIKTSHREKIYNYIEVNCDGR